MDVQVEVASDYKGTVNYRVEYYNGSTRTTLTKSTLSGVNDFYEGSRFSAGDKGVKQYSGFLMFPRILKYRLYAIDRTGNEGYLDFNVQTGTVSTGTDAHLTGNAATFQKQLDEKKDALLSTLATTLQRIQNIYNTKVQPLVETSMFKAVACLGFLTANATDVDVLTIQNEYQKAILEKYVEISADIKRFSVGLLTNEKTISNAIYDFGSTFASQISTIETTYETTFATLKADFEVYYTQNKELVYGLAEKIQKIDTIQAQYNALQQAQTQLYQTLDSKTTLRTALLSPQKSFTNLLKGDIDDLIRNYQTSNPEVSYEKMTEKRDSLVTAFVDETTSFINELFKSDIDEKLYLSTLEKTKDFLTQYTVERSYQCGLIIASTLNRERTYLDLTQALKTLIQGVEKAEEKVHHRDTNQVKTIETTMMTLLQDAYNKILTTKKKEFMSYVMQLISEAYYANIPQPTEPTAPTPSTVSWTPYTFTKTYNKGTYALELTYLQQFLKAQGLYNGEINGLYDAKTIEAVYHFQLQEGVVSGKEANKAAYGRMGPATRAAVNKKMNP
ncbi:MAG: peptidoglycan-binding protein [Candidatus Peribacteria bacterium]|nr:peptidoglycan-binding protein [Candidatus Peribacteria bacterium]